MCKFSLTRLLIRPAASRLFLSALLLIAGLSVANAENLKPFTLADAATGDFAQTVKDTKAKLTKAGFEVLGEYSPYDKADIIIVTNDTLKKNAAATDFGGYGAVQRIAITDVSGTIQVTYTNPVYMAAAYRLASNLESVAADLKAALGEQEAYGSKKGLSKDDLGDYHYMFGMPYFDEPSILADHGSYDKAMKAVKAALDAKKGGVSKVFQVDIPGKKQTIIGVAMTQDMSSDAEIMKHIDSEAIRSTAHLPYEILIDDKGKVYTLKAEFRIAISFPDLPMMGDHSFKDIMSSPDAIKKALTLAAGAAGEDKSSDGFDF